MIREKLEQISGHSESAVILNKPMKSATNFNMLGNLTGS